MSLSKATIIKSLTFLLLSLTSLGQKLDSFEVDDLDQISLADLLSMRVRSVDALTNIDKGDSPSTVTRITAEDIKKSGARNIDEVLEMYVPNYQTARLNTTGQKLGIRGVISDLDNKFLMTVNGRVMNDKTAYGAETERYLSMLGDIAYIDVIRGAGSAIYGPGAIGGVINIITHDALTFSGSKVSVRQGAIEDFTSFEYSHSWKLDADSGFYLYYGVDYYKGSKASDSPLKFSHELRNLGNTPGEAIESGIERESAAYRDHTRHKLHFSYRDDSWYNWIRYTKGGEKIVAHHSDIEGTSANPSLGLDESNNGTAYQQLTLYSSYLWDYSDEIDIDFILSYDWKDKENVRPYTQRIYDLGAAFIHYMEEEFFAKTLLRWTPNSYYSAAYGVEYSYDRFLRRSPGFPHQSPFIFTEDPWFTHTVSLLTEHQIHINEENTLFLGGMATKHSFTDWMYSPRISHIYHPSATEAYKFIYNRSVRRSDDFELIDQERMGQSGDTETIDQFEFRYERSVNCDFNFAVGAFYNRHEIVNFDYAEFRSVPLGVMHIVGAELEVDYSIGKLDVSASHGYVRLLNFKLDGNPHLLQFNSSEPDNGSNHLANWSDHITKVQVDYSLTDDVQLHGSLVYYWGFQGGEDYADFNNSQNPQPRYRALTDNGQDEAFDASVFLNLGVTVNVGKNSVFSLRGHNVLGWFDKDLNKRNYYGLGSTYRSDAASVSASWDYKF